MPVAALVGAAVTVALGMFGAIAPRAAARMVGLAPTDPGNFAEVRATYGGLYLAMGGACLVFRTSEAYAITAAAWLGAAVLRCVSLAVDRRATRRDFAGVTLEAAVGLRLASGAF